MRFLFTFLLATTLGPAVWAEYRAFELNIDDTEKGSTRVVVSTLDHLQYPRFYPLNKNEVIRYVDSWMCYENMSHFQPPCRKPDGTLPGRSTAAEPKSNSAPSSSP